MRKKIKNSFMICMALSLSLTSCSLVSKEHTDASGDSVGEESVDELAKNENGEAEQNREDDSILAKLQVREDILAAMEASGRLSGRNFILSENGEIYFGDGKYKNYAYAYYEMPVSSVFTDDAGSAVLAVMENGSVYNGTTLLIGEDRVRDVAWKTHSTNVDAYMLTSDGNVYFYNLYENNGRGNNYLEYLSMSVKFTAICRAQSYPIFFGEDGKLYFPSMFYSGGSADWTGIETDGWNNVVVAACAYLDSGIHTVAAISADGTVMAQGDYAEDILAMGELSYITMFDDASLIAGLTKDGNLVYAGSNAGQYRGKELSGIAGVKAFGKALYAAGTDGTVYQVTPAEVRSYKFDMTANGETEYCLSAEGQFYMTDVESGRWIQAEMKNASTENRLNLLYDLELNENGYNEFNTKRGIEKGMYTFGEYDKFKLQDLNGDGEKELIIDNGSITYITCIYNGELSAAFSDDYLNGYYPESQILCSNTYGGCGSTVNYGSLIQGNYSALLRHVTTVEYDASLDDTVEIDYYYYYGEEDLLYTDEEGEALRREDAEAVSAAEYEELLSSLVGDEVMQVFSYEDCLPCTRENFQTAFLN